MNLKIKWLKVENYFKKLTSHRYEVLVGNQPSLFTIAAHRFLRIGSRGKAFMRKPFSALFVHPNAQQLGILLKKKAR